MEISGFKSLVVVGNGGNFLKLIKEAFLSLIGLLGGLEPIVDHFGLQFMVI